jgi:hypothetical protein
VPAAPPRPALVVVVVSPVALLAVLSRLAPVVPAPVVPAPVVPAPVVPAPVVPELEEPSMPPPVHAFPLPSSFVRGPWVDEAFVDSELWSVDPIPLRGRSSGVPLAGVMVSLPFCRLQANPPNVTATKTTMLVICR